MSRGTLDSHFPLPRTHTGILLGNAVLGAMIWGGGNQLNITLGRADFWDRRGGKPWTPRMNYRAIRNLLETSDEPGLRDIFKEQPAGPGQPPRPSVLPIGRLELHFLKSVTLTRGTLHLDTGLIVIHLTDDKGAQHELRFDLAMNDPLFHVELPENLPAPEIRRMTSWNYIAEQLNRYSFDKPELLDRADLTGWLQTRPDDEPLCVGYRMTDRDLWIAVDIGKDTEDAKTETATLLARAISEGPSRLRKDTADWWSRYWKDVPSISIPNPRLQFIYDYGMYKLAGLTQPRGVAATLQGPWIEEYQMPPWSSDYHFNINVQMCYWPAYQGNRLSHLRPLFDMIWSWRDILRENARHFVGIDDGYVLPHAVSDRCGIVGAFWTGTIDHACTAWVGKMMYDYYLYTGDEKFLRDVAYPFMHGAMRVFEEMLEKDGERYTLAVSVSPEYRGAAMNAWGRNASFQLGCIHWLIEALLNSCKVLSEKPRDIWLDIQKNLPKACIQSPQGKPKIMLWERTDLEESHRHHSHFAGLYPWDIFDLTNPDDKQLILITYDWWHRQGMGLWSGWCVPWAAMLHARAGSPEMAEATLEYWQHLFTNEGHGTLHDPRIFKRNLHANLEPAPMTGRGGGGDRGEIMQIEAGMAAAAAILDFLVHVRRGVHYFFQGAPSTWRDVSFKGIRTEGAFLVSATRRANKVEFIEIKSEIGGVFRFQNPWTGAIQEVPTRKGETLRLTA